MAEILEESYHIEKRQGKEEMGGKPSKHLHAKAPLEEKKGPKPLPKGRRK